MMTILLVDSEHERVVADPARGSSHRVRLDSVRRRLAAAAGAPCQSIHYCEISPALVERAATTALVIGGNTTDWAEFDAAALVGLLETIRAAPVPTLGICAGHQLIGYAHDAPWGPLGPLRAGEADPDPRFAPGQRKERGFSSVQIDVDCPLFRGLAGDAVVFQSHYWQLEGVPQGFVARAASPWSPIQAIERLDRPVFGVQFHPERADAAHPDGATILHNFFALARGFAAGG